MAAPADDGSAEDVNGSADGCPAWFDEVILSKFDSVLLREGGG